MLPPNPNPLTLTLYNMMIFSLQLFDYHEFNVCFLCKFGLELFYRLSSSIAFLMVHVLRQAVRWNR
jgi:hypothetical protein